VTACEDPNLMQAPRRSAKGTVSVAHEMLKVQNDPPRVIEITGEGTQSFRLSTSVKDGTANLGRKAVNVLRIVTMFHMVGAALG